MNKFLNILSNIVIYVYLILAVTYVWRYDYRLFNHGDKALSYGAGIYSVIIWTCGLLAIRFGERRNVKET